MSGEYKRCPNGHYYQGISCPYCKTNGPKTDVYVPGGKGTTTVLEPYDGNETRGGTATETRGKQETVLVDGQKPTFVPGKTEFGPGDEPTQYTNGHAEPKNNPRYSRKLVGWLVTYSFDELGVDYKLYEGRNTIGRDVDCNITTNDGRMSGRHAVILFRANKYSITDTQSSHGTFVNDEDIELEPRYLKDGDIIRMGNTVFKFRTSL